MFKLSVVFQFSAYRDTDDTTKGTETKMAKQSVRQEKTRLRAKSNSKFVNDYKLFQFPWLPALTFLSQYDSMIIVSSVLCV